MADATGDDAMADAGDDANEGAWGAKWGALAGPKSCIFAKCLTSGLQCSKSGEKG